MRVKDVMLPLLLLLPLTLLLTLSLTFLLPLLIWLLLLLLLLLVLKMLFDIFLGMLLHQRNLPRRTQSKPHQLLDEPCAVTVGVQHGDQHPRSGMIGR